MIDHREKQEISDFPSKLSLRQKACESIMILLATHMCYYCCSPLQRE